MTTHDYGMLTAVKPGTSANQSQVRPQITDTLAVRAGRHPIREKIMKTPFVPNDVYATQQSRFQIITGCNMSGSHTSLSFRITKLK